MINMMMTVMRMRGEICEKISKKYDLEEKVRIKRGKERERKDN